MGRCGAAARRWMSALARTRASNFLQFVPKLTVPCAYIFVHDSNFISHNTFLSYVTLLVLGFPLLIDLFHHARYQGVQNVGTHLLRFYDVWEV